MSFALSKHFALPTPEASQKKQTSNPYLLDILAGHLVGRPVVKLWTVRSAACGPARRTGVGRPSICQPRTLRATSAAGAVATGARATGRRPPGVRAAAPGAGAGFVACFHRPITPFMGPSTPTRPQLVSWTTIY